MSLDSEAASRGGSATQPERAATMPVLRSGLGAAERAALMAIEKGGVRRRVYLGEEYHGDRCGIQESDWRREAEC